MGHWIKKTGIVVPMDKKCMLVECNREEHGRKGYCKMHYRRVMTTGDPYKVRKVHRDTPVLERFNLIGWTEVEGRLDTPCWEWNGNCSSDKNGYGSLGVKGVSHRIHRLSYELFVGEIPPGQLIRHKCDNPPCMNPEHLEPGTVRQNAIDMLERGRHKPPRGETNGTSKLSEGDVKVIWSLKGTPVSDVAAKFDISTSTIYSIWNGRRWNYLTSTLSTKGPQ